MKYVMFRADTGEFEQCPSHPETAILNFVFFVSEQEAAGETIAIGPFDQPFPALIGWRGNGPDDMKMVGALLGASREEWGRYGPPDSIAMSEEEQTKRGFGKPQ